MWKNHHICRCVAAFLAALTLLAVGCAGEVAADVSDTAAVTTAVPETTPPLLEQLTQYTLVRPEEGSLYTRDAALELRRNIETGLGTGMTIATDWVKPGDAPDAAGEREILFGATNRTASIEAMAELGSFDYLIRTVGDDIVVTGGSDYALLLAADKFFELLSAGQGTFDYVYRYEENKREDEVMLRVASYNIRHGADVGLDMQILAEDITGLNIDVVGLQEVDQNAKRSGHIDTMKQLSAASGMVYYAFAKGIPLGGGEYGTGILSRWPIVSFEVTQLESDDHEQRSIGHAILDVNGTQVHFFNTHLSFESKETRTKQFAQIAELLPKDAPWLLTGDFNTADFAEFDVLNYAVLLNRAGRSQGTFISKNTPIDNVVLSAGWRVWNDGVLKVKHSDHYMIWCDTYLEAAEK